MSLADEDLQPLFAMVRADRGIDLSQYKDKFLRRRIGVRLRATRAHSLKHYLRVLGHSGEEYDSFVDSLTVTTSSFFRNRECFEALSLHILPRVAALAAERRLRPPLLWSAGCARGEEAYSLAMLAARVPGLEPHENRPLILATDISSAALDLAREGVYDHRAVSDMDASEADLLFEREGKRYRVPEALRSMVSFARHDILHQEPPGQFLLVLCRNLMIYLEKEAQERLMMRLAEAVREGGYLVLGKSEILVGEARELFAPDDPAERIYRRIGCGEGVAGAIRGSRRTA